MADTPFHRLSRRERQIVDVLYALGEAAAADVAARLPDRPAYNSVRVTLGILEKKGVVRHRRDGARYVYAPVLPLEKAKRKAASHLLATFFRGSPSAAIVTLLDLSRDGLSAGDLAEIESLIAKAKRQGGRR